MSENPGTAPSPRGGRRARKGGAAGRGPVDIAHIPIYWRDSSRHARYFEKHKEKTRSEWSKWGPEAVAEFERRYAGVDPHGWYPWRYNDVIGWVRIHAERGLVHFALHLKRKGRGRRVAEVCELVDESYHKIYGAMIRSNEDASRQAIEAITAMAAEPPLDRYFVDSEGFEWVAGHLDWLGLIAESSAPRAPCA